jgi:hypothetical protein
LRCAARPSGFTTKAIDVFAVFDSRGKRRVFQEKRLLYSSARIPARGLLFPPCSHNSDMCKRLPGALPSRKAVMIELHADSKSVQGGAADA